MLSFYGLLNTAIYNHFACEYCTYISIYVNGYLNSEQGKQLLPAMPFVRLRPTRLLLPWNLTMMASWQRYW